MGSGSYCVCAFISIFILFFVVGLPLILVFAPNHNKDPIFTVESSTVKAYNLTSDNRLFCIFDFSVRAHNPDGKHSVNYRQLDLEVRKGKHHKLADDVITPFRQPKGDNDTVVAVEAVGLYVKLKDEIAAEMRADRAAGVMAVNVFFSGSLGSDNIEIKCGNVKVYFGDGGGGGEFVKVGCNVNVYDPNANN